MQGLLKLWDKDLQDASFGTFICTTRPAVSMRPKVLITGPIHDAGLDLLKSAVSIEGGVGTPMRREEILERLGGQGRPGCREPP